jgi:hypothetical protein
LVQPPNLRFIVAPAWPHLALFGLPFLYHVQLCIQFSLGPRLLAHSSALRSLRLYAVGSGPRQTRKWRLEGYILSSYWMECNRSGLNIRFVGCRIGGTRSSHALMPLRPGNPTPIPQVPKTLNQRLATAHLTEVSSESKPLEDSSKFSRVCVSCSVKSQLSLLLGSLSNVGTGWARCLAFLGREFRWGRGRPDLCQFRSFFLPCVEIVLTNLDLLDKSIVCMVVEVVQVGDKI